MAVFSPADTAVPAGKSLSRAEAAILSSKVFLLNPAYQQHLHSTSKGLARIIAMLLLLVLGIAAVICVGTLLLASVSADGPERSVNLVGALLLAALFGGVILLIYRAYRRSIRIPADRTFLQGTVVSASSRERSTGTKIARGFLAVFVIILEIVAALSSNASSSGGWGDDDFYEVTVNYTAATPSGSTINGTAKHNRPDLRKTGLPAAGTPVLVSYQDDAHFDLL